MSATTELPTLDPATAAGGEAAGGLAGLLEVVGALGAGSDDSPLAGVGTALAGIESRLDIDVSGLTERLPAAVTTIRNALPADSLRYVEEIELAYRGVSEFLHDSELARQIQAGADLEQIALAVVDDVLALFRTRLQGLAASLVGADELARVAEALAMLEDLRTDFAAHAGELLPFVSANLLGVEPDLLDGAAAHVGSALAVLDPLADASVELRLAPSRDALTAAARDVAGAVARFDPADAAQYAALELKLQTLDVALDAALGALESFYGAAATVVESHAWDATFTAYRDLLAAIPLAAIPTVDDAVDQIARVLDDLLARLTMTFGPEDLAGRVAAMSTSVQESFAQSPLGQVRRVITDFLEEIRRTIEQVPTEEVRRAVTDMLHRVRQELDDLGITSVRAAIAEGFQDAEDFIDEQLGDDLLEEVEDALAAVSEQLAEIPIAEVGQRLTEAVDAAGEVVQELEGAILEALDEVRALLARLDELSFRPVADEVLEEIDALRAKLQSIRPESMSDAERLAIQAGLAVLRAIDLEGLIVRELKAGFGAVSDEVTRLIERVLAAWNDLRGRLGHFDPDAVLGPVTAVIGEVTDAVSQVNGTALLGPLYAQVDAMEARLAALSPGSVLDALRAPYGEMMAFVERANPDVWVAPLRQLYEEIDRLLAFIDARPLLDTLEARERALFAEARQAMVDGLDAVHLPPPLDAFYDQIKVVALALGDALFGDPGEAIRQVRLDVRRTMAPSTLFAPLDALFDRLLEALDAVPRAELVAAMEALRTGLGVALPALDPGAVLAALRAGESRLASLSPSLAGPALSALPALRASLAARLAPAPPAHGAAGVALLARFDLVLAPVRPDLPASRLTSLRGAHAALATSLRHRINALDATGAQAEYLRLHASLDRLLPAFLRQTRPLSYEDIRGGLAEMRPSRKARRLDERLELFLARLRPMQGALEPAIDGLFATLREAVLLIHPGALKDAVGAVYDALRAKVRVLDPDELAQQLREDVYEPLLDPLRALDPAAIQAQIDALFRHLLGRLAGTVRGVLDRVKAVVDALLGEVRTALLGVVESLRVQVEAIVGKLGEILRTLDALVVDELFGRLLRVIANLRTSFDQELDRVRNAFDAMLDASPVGSGGGAAAVGA